MGGEHLLVTAGAAAGRRLSLDRALEIGRDAPGEGTLGNDALLSRRHARVSRGTGGELLIEDLGSTNGTFVNGSRITGSCPLKPGDRVQVGGATLELVAPPEAAPAPEASPASPAAAPPPAPFLRSRAPLGQPSVIRAGLPPTMKGLIFPSIGLLVVQVVVGYEWLLSGLTKLVRGGFPQGLGDELDEMSEEAAGWVRSFLDYAIIPNATAFGYLIEIVELLVGIVLIVAAFLWLFRWETMRRRQREGMLLGTALACGAGIFMNVQFYLASGEPPPFFLAREPFDEGVGLDVIMPMLEVILAGVALWTLFSLRRARRRPAAPSAAPKHVVVAGGGFGGLAAARALEREAGGNVRVTVVSDANFLLYTPLLPDAAAGVLEPTSVVIPLREQLGRADLVVGRVVGCDPERRCLEYEPLGLPDRPGRHTVAPAGVERIQYDHLIVALGSVSRPLDAPGLAEHAIGFKTLPEATALRNWVISTLERAEALDDPDARAPYLTYVFVGAGYAGLEGAAALHDLADRAIALYPRCRLQGMRWLLVQAGERVMPEVAPRLAEFAARKLARRGIEVLTGTTLEEVGAASVRLSGGRVVPTRTVVWTAGVRAHPATGGLGLPLDERGRIRVDACLRVEGRPDVWAVGDAAAVPDPRQQWERPCPPTAQHAVHQGALAAVNVAAVLESQPPQPFTYTARGVFVNLGRGTGVAEIAGVRVRGPVAWLLGRAFHASRMPGPRRKLRLLAGWGLNVMQGRDASELGNLGHPRTLFGELEGQSAGGTSVVHVRHLAAPR